MDEALDNWCHLLDAWDDTGMEATLLGLCKFARDLFGFVETGDFSGYYPSFQELWVKEFRVEGARAIRVCCCMVGGLEPIAERTMTIFMGPPRTARCQFFGLTARFETLNPKHLNPTPRNP